MQQWEVHWYDQKPSRDETDPPQPGDPSDKRRLFIVVSPNAHLRSGGDPVCVPIGSSSNSSFVHVEIPKGKSGVSWDCYAWCDEIYTLKRSYFKKKVGFISAAKQEEIKQALRDFFELY